LDIGDAFVENKLSPSGDGSASVRSEWTQSYGAVLEGEEKQNKKKKERGWQHANQNNSNNKQRQNINLLRNRAKLHSRFHLDVTVKSSLTLARWTKTLSVRPDTTKKVAGELLKRQPPVVITVNSLKQHRRLHVRAPNQELAQMWLISQCA
jgi:hypothetical protein